MNVAFIPWEILFWGRRLCLQIEIPRQSHTFISVVKLLADNNVLICDIVLYRLWTTVVKAPDRYVQMPGAVTIAFRAMGRKHEAQVLHALSRHGYTWTIHCLKSKRLSQPDLS